MAITKEQAMRLTHNTYLHDPTNRPCESKVGPARWRVNGRCKSWVRNPSRFELPVKHGLYAYDYITELTPATVHLESECPVVLARERASVELAEVLRAIAERL